VALLAGDFGFMRRGIVLEFLTGLEVIAAGGNWGFLADAVTPAEGRQCWIRHIGSTAHQFFMDPDQIAFVRGQQLQDLNPVLSSATVFEVNGRKFDQVNR
jgi:hypothetical protein